MTTAKDHLSSVQHFLPQFRFATPIWSLPLEGMGVCNQQILDLSERLNGSSEGVQRSNQGGWHSDDRLHKMQELQLFSDRLLSVAAQCLTSLDYDADHYHLLIRDMWLNINRSGDSNIKHVHPMSDISGTYYLTAPEDSGDLAFYDPNLARSMRPMPVRSEKAQTTDSISFTPVAGTLILFPSWLEHAVMPNNSSEPRISLSFNLLLKRNP